ncbi:helix-turn-helix domain-containing protein [Halomonas lysinitropha]|uniref:Insertion element IS150 protein InsJ-like helix-turn-helix domain-containing protein n=1 Tax=Halomonas lysinitropha TaxID=2607506 RepID=A0A5K1I6R6_9GAMM|nr:helix-turn-helix domain-containing protein [Halomonas lysinitropha]VVZ95753.1 hypothetical protein HALO32_01832 [Halomonas lysinitropha]
MPTKHLTPEILNKLRLEAVRLRLDGHTVAETAARTGLSAPTVSAAWKAFREGGWDAVAVRQRGRRAGQAASLDAAARQALETALATLPPTGEPAWSSRGLAEALKGQGHRVSPRAIDHWLERRDLKPEPLALNGLARRRSQLGRWYRQQLAPVLAQVKQTGGAVWQGGARTPPPDSGLAEEPRRYQLYLHGKRGALFTRVLAAPPLADDYLALFERLLATTQVPVALIFRGADLQAAPAVGDWLSQHPEMRLVMMPAGLPA